MRNVRLIFIRKLAGSDALRPGEYRKVKSGKRWTAKLACPLCGFEALLDHDVSESGDVSPSVVCPSDSCSFHEFAHLSGWGEG